MDKNTDFIRLFRDNPAPICVSRKSDGHILNANDRFAELLGSSREELLGRSAGALLNRDGSPRDLTEASGIEFSFRTRSGERRTLRALSRIVMLDGVECLITDLLDVTELRRSESATRGQALVLESIISDAELEETLTLLVQVIEAQHEGMMASVLLLDDDGVHVHHAAAPSLPPEYVRAVDGLPIGPQAGSCGTAMYTGQPIIVSDILTDPLWEPYRGFAASYGLRACWSAPILSREGRMLGSFAMYHSEVRQPTAGEYDLIGVAVKTAGIAIERKRSQRALHRSEERFRSMVENISDVFFTTDEHGVLTYVSPSVEALTGFAPPEVVGQAYVDMLIPEDKAIVAEALERRLAGSTESLEYRILTKSGEVRWARCSTRPVRVGNRVEGLQGVIVDIHSRRLAEEEALRSQVLLQSIMDTSPSMISVKDRQGRYLLANRRFHEVFGLGSQSILGRTDQELFAQERAETFRAADRAALDEGRTVELEEPVEQADGLHYYIAVRSPLRNVAGEIHAVCCMSTDITGFKQVEEQLRQSQKMEAIGRLAGGIAHDFNNLLTAINGYSALALSQVEPDQPLHLYLTEILRSGERATGLTRQLLAYGRKQMLAPTLLNLTTVVQDILGMLNRLIGEHIRLVTSLDQGLESVKADRGQIEQILLNLAVNARDAMPEGGELVIGTANTRLSAAEAATLEMLPGPVVRLWVSDTGSGMSPETLNRLFEPFYTTKEVGKGIGLGLSVVYGIVKQSGGGIAVRSRPHAGTTFSISFPVASLPNTQPSKSAVPLSAARTLSAGTGETVLQVEDEDAVRRYTDLALKSLGYRVLSAADGMEALRIVEQEGPRIHLVLTDVVMPGLGGRELVGEIRRLHPGMPALYVSGYEEAPADDVPEDTMGLYLQKPFTPAELAFKVRRALALGTAYAGPGDEPGPGPADAGGVRIRS